MKMYSRNNISLSVIVPGLNEEQNIRAAMEDLLKVLRSALPDWEIILINDGSTDRTGAIMEEFARKEAGIRVIHHALPMGIGYSMLEGIRTASKTVVTWVPADGENDPNELLKYLPLIEHVDIVIPFVINKRVRPLHRRILSAMYLSVINVTFRTRFNYTNGNIIYRKAVFDTVHPRSNGFLVHAECLVRAIRAGFTFAEVPVSLRRRSEGDSKALLLKSFTSVVREYLVLLISLPLFRGGRQ